MKSFKYTGFSFKIIFNYNEKRYVVSNYLGSTTEKVKTNKIYSALVWLNRCIGCADSRRRVGFSIPQPNVDCLQNLQNYIGKIAISFARNLGNFFMEDGLSKCVTIVVHMFSKIGWLSKHCLATYCSGAGIVNKISSYS